MNLSIPSKIVEMFETKANTERGMDTGGILAGQQVGNSFKVTHLIIQEQIAANYRWELQDNFFVYHEMIMLGLIHTHLQMTYAFSSGKCYQGCRSCRLCSDKCCYSQKPYFWMLASH